MSNHPNRKQLRFPASLLAGIDGPPLTDLVMARRWAASITQAEAAKLLYVDLRSYQRWEYGERKMPAAIWALFLILTHERPTK